MFVGYIRLETEKHVKERDKHEYAASGLHGLSARATSILFSYAVMAPTKDIDSMILHKYNNDTTLSQLSYSVQTAISIRILFEYKIL